MNKLGKIAALIGATLTCSVSAHANSNGPHSVIRVYVGSGDPDVALSSGNTVLYSSRVSCPKDVTSCTLVLSAMDQICNPVGKGGINNFTVLVSVDSVDVDEGAGGGTGYDPCDTRGWMGNVAVGPGPHKVVLSTDITGSTTGVQHNWSVNYTVTTP